MFVLELNGPARLWHDCIWVDTLEEQHQKMRGSCSPEFSLIEQHSLTPIEFHRVARAVSSNRHTELPDFVFLRLVFGKQDSPDSWWS